MAEHASQSVVVTNDCRYFMALPGSHDQQGILMNVWDKTLKFHCGIELGKGAKEARGTGAFQAFPITQGAFQGFPRAQKEGGINPLLRPQIWGIFKRNSWKGVPSN